MTEKPGKTEMLCECGHSDEDHSKFRGIGCLYRLPPENGKREVCPCPRFTPKAKDKK